MFGMMNPQMYPQANGQIKQPQFMGQWLSAGNYQEMLALPIPLNGAPVLVSLSDEPVMYVLQMQNGQKVLSGFSITPLPGVNNSTPSSEKTDVDARLEKIEQALANLSKPVEKKEATGYEKSLTPIS